MKTYSKENYTNYAEFEKALVDECIVNFISHKATYRDRVVNLVSFTFEDANFGTDVKRVLKVMVELEPGSITKLVFNLAVNSGVLKLNEEDNNKYKEINKVFEEAMLIHNQELEEEKRLLDLEIEKVQKERIAKLVEQAKLEQELKAKKKIDKQLAKLEKLQPENTSKLFDAPQSQYEILGWMTRHLTSIRASMPDYMEKWFVSKFGDVERYTVNSKKKTVNGNPMQWGLSLKLTFDEEVKGPLEVRATSQNKKTIDNVAFVWDLIENYGFQFGKKQDYNKIVEEVPSQYIKDFEHGFAM